MAVVWRALVRGAGRFARPVAVKRIHAAKGADQHFVELFEEEARVGSGLQHPNVVQIMDFGLDEDGDYYLVMEWIEGMDLHHWVRSYPPGIELTPWSLVAALGMEVCRGLGAAHERIDEDGEISPVFHRDVSPSNILLGTNGAVKLVDFGLARAMDRASMTRPNVIKGKLAYCAPELVTGAKASAQSDLFAVGVVLWETLAQQRLFTGKNDLEVLLSVRKGEIMEISELRHDLPGALVAAVHQALLPDPNDRFESAKAMARALASILHAAPEPVDADLIGRSVREARERLGMAKKAQKASPPVPTEPSGFDIHVSVSELEIPTISKPRVRGLWNEASAEKKEQLLPDDPSVSFELTRKKS